MRTVIQYIEQAGSEAEAFDILDLLDGMEDCLGARVIGDGKRKPWAVQAFFKIDQCVKGASLPDGCRAVQIPNSLIPVLMP